MTEIKLDIAFGGSPFLSLQSGGKTVEDKMLEQFLRQALIGIKATRTCGEDNCFRHFQITAEEEKK